MCRTEKCCYLLDLHFGTKAIAFVGIVLTFIHMIILVFGGKDVFVVLSFYDANYVYVGVVILVINFFVHCLLWSGAHQERSKELLPWMIFMLIKMLVMGSVGLNMATTFMSSEQSPGERLEFCSVLCTKPIPYVRETEDLNAEFQFCVNCVNQTEGIFQKKLPDFETRFRAICKILDKPELIQKAASNCQAKVTTKDVGQSEAKDKTAVDDEGKPETMEETTEEDSTTAPRIISILYVIVFLCVHFYFWIVVFSLYMELKDNRMSGGGVV